MTEPSVNVRKTLAGSVSGGYVWPEDGAVIPVPYHFALELLKIRDGGFSVVEPEAPAQDEEITEPAPPARAAVTEPASRRPRARTADS
jgi:hypothetical protein